MNKNKKLHNKEDKKSINWTKVSGVIKDISTSILLLILIVIFVYVIGNDINYHKNMREIIKDSNYITIEEINEELVLQYHTKTRKISIAYLDRRFRKTKYIRRELPYSYNIETKNFEYTMEE